MSQRSLGGFTTQMGISALQAAQPNTLRQNFLTHARAGRVPFTLASVLALGLTQSACYEVDYGPALDTPVAASNACLDLAETDPDAQASPEALVDVFDCLNSEGAFEALRAPLTYVVDKDYLDPYFIPDYLATFNAGAYVTGGDIQLTVQNLEALINDPDEPLAALLDLYVELYHEGYLAALLHLSQDYTSYLYSGCPDGLEVCTFSAILDRADELYHTEELKLLLEAVGENQGQVDPAITDAIQNDAIAIAKQITADVSPTGENLLLSLAAAFVTDPLPPDPDRSVDDPYSSQSWTILRSLQKPLCQLRSDRNTIDTLLALSSELTATGQSAYLPLYLRTLANVNPSGTPMTTTPSDSQDLDGDGYSLADGDCNDNDVAIRPGAPEIDDRIDNNCDLVADKKPSTTDGDGDGVSPAQGDCNDADDTIYTFLRIHYSNGDQVSYPAAPEFGEEGLTYDRKDNDCDGFVDQIPSSMQMLFRSAGLLLPLVYADSGDGNSNLTVGIEALVNQGGASIDVADLLESNADTIDTVIYNYNNGTLPPDLTALVRVNLPVAYQLADMGLLNTSSVEPIVALYQDHLDYQEAYANANSSEKQKFEQYKDACGEEFEQYVDTLKVLDELVRVIDAYEVINEPNMQALIPIVVNSDLLLDMAKMPTTPLGDFPEEVIDAVFYLFDYFLKPPLDSGLYSDNYDEARLWEFMPLANVLLSDPIHVDQLDDLMVYGLHGLEEPTSALYRLPDAMAALQSVQTGGTVDMEGLTEMLLSSENRQILVNFLAIPADPNFTHILLGEWDELPADVRAKYETSESTFAFTVRWVEEGIIDRFLDMAGTMLEWVVENTGFGDPIDSEGTAPTPTAVPETSPTPAP